MFCNKLDLTITELAIPVKYTVVIINNYNSKFQIIANSHFADDQLLLAKGEDDL